MVPRDQQTALAACASRGDTGAAISRPASLSREVPR